MENVLVMHYCVPEREYLESVRASLLRLPIDQVALIVLSKKLAKITDLDRSVVFAIKTYNPIKCLDILEWAKFISTERILLPELKVNYLVATMTKERFDEIFQKIDDIDDPMLRSAFQLYRESLDAQVSQQ